MLLYTNQQNNSLNSINSKVILINNTIVYFLRKLGFVSRLASGLFKKTLGQGELAGRMNLVPVRCQEAADNAFKIEKQHETSEFALANSFLEENYCSAQTRWFDSVTPSWRHCPPPPFGKPAQSEASKQRLENLGVGIKTHGTQQYRKKASSGCLFQFFFMFMPSFSMLVKALKSLWQQTSVPPTPEAARQDALHLPSWATHVMGAFSIKWEQCHSKTQVSHCSRPLQILLLLNLMAQFQFSM